MEIFAITSAVRDTFGKQLSEIYRWQRYRTSETDAEWQEFLGPTAVGLSHQELLVYLADGFTDQECFSPEQKELFLAACAVHDIGEIQYGDIPAPLKTQQDEQDEAVVALELIEKLKPLYSFVGYLKHAYMQVVCRGDEKHYAFFIAIQETEYIMTILNGYRFLKKHNRKDIKKWELMIAPIINHLHRVVEFARIYPNSIGNYLSLVTDELHSLIDDASEYATEKQQPELRECKAVLRQWQTIILTRNDVTVRSPIVPV